MNHRFLHLLTSGLLACAAALAAGSAAPPARGAAAPRPPNLLVIVADDLGWGDVGYHSSQIRTPNLDRLAAEGVRLEQCYVAPVCSPSRAALMSGRYWSRFGVTTPTNNRCLPYSTVTLASALKSVGYETALTGKWHLGSRPEEGPNHFGFDRSYGSLAGGVGPYTHAYKRGAYSRTWHRNEQLIEEEGHVTDLITREAVGLIERKRERPFFLYVPFTAPHLPIDEPEQWEQANAHIQDPALRLYGACITHMDAGVGKLLDALRRTGQRENTLVLFFSDNGGSTGVENNDTQYPGTYRSVRLPASNVPLRGKKGQLYEGGIRVPALIQWPGRLKPGTVNAPLHVIDWMPTLTRLAGCAPPTDLKWDGRDIWPVIAGEDRRPAERTLYWLGVSRRESAVRRGDWKLLVPQKGPPQLFNLAADPGEAKDLAAEQPERVEELKRLLAEAAARDDDALPKDPAPGK
jgi:arylsulfatase I/J